MIGLGLGLTLGNPIYAHRAPTKPPLCQAIDKLVFVSAVRNGKTITLAPHAVYKHGKKGELRLDAVKQDKKPNLATFKVADLSEINLLETVFSPHAGFNPNDAKYTGKTVCVIKLVENADDGVEAGTGVLASV